MSKSSVTGPSLKHYNAVIVGAGLAGLSLARQLLMQSEKRVLLLEKWPTVPISHQKVGEATVQVSGYYFSKVLDLEEHLLRDHLMKYNLRFYWKTPGRNNDSFEDYSQSFIRNFSNIASYQLNRNKVEGEMLRLNLENPNFAFQPGISNLDATLRGTGQPHLIRFQVEGDKMEVQADWIVDTTGRAQFLSRRLGLVKPSPIRHGSTFFWVDGLLNIEKLTRESDRQRLTHKNRRMTGHLPIWLATNHFAGEGFWFWVIPLQGRTSLGLVYDKTKIPEHEVSSAEKVVAWVCRQFPLFARELPKRKIVDEGMFRDFAYDCRQTISADQWALSGEAGRFTDPLYSPGGDLIALYNTLITDAILTDNPNVLAVKVRVYELLMWAFYEAYVPSYAVSYDALGDQECYALKYGWELTIYFTFYVFPFINQVFTETAFVVPYLDLFAKLGVLNHNLQAFITQYYHWKKTQPAVPHEPNFYDFTFLEPLKKSEELFYEIGLSGAECLRVLKQSISNIERLARFIAVYIYSVVLGDEDLLSNKELIKTINIENLRFDPERMRQECQSLDPAKDERLAKIGANFVMQFRRNGDKSVHPGLEKPIPAAISIATAASYSGRR
jgi:2-polyprenyl-6-methoxyphenol hydroxylase-like FAD-dependent oxidoreductase